MNLLIEGDNIAGLSYLLQERKLQEKIDLVYIDPPFATGGNFTITKDRAATISNSKRGSVAYSDRLTGYEFVEFLRQRLLLLRDLLSASGSIYLHTDYKIGHYIKVMMDEVFGMDNFRNDITRVKCNPKNFKRTGYGNVKDLILFYSKASHPIWNEPKKKYSASDIERLFPKTDQRGRRYTTVPIHAPGETERGKSNQPFRGMMPPKGRHWRTDVETLERWDRDGLIEWSATGNPRKVVFADERAGKRVQDIWKYKDPPYPVYPTEKNAELLDLIIRTSSNPGSMVLDCFCGSGTTLKAAQRLNRNWIGMDQSEHAIRATSEKLGDGEGDFFTSKPEYEFLQLATCSQER